MRATEAYFIKPVFSYLCTLTTWQSLHLSTSAAATDQYRLPVGPTAANLLGQTDGRTTKRYIDPAPHTMQAVSIRTNRLVILND